MGQERDAVDSSFSTHWRVEHNALWDPVFQALHILANVKGRLDFLCIDEICILCTI